MEKHLVVGAAVITIYGLVSTYKKWKKNRIDATPESLRNNSSFKQECELLLIFFFVVIPKAAYHVVFVLLVVALVTAIIMSPFYFFGLVSGLVIWTCIIVILSRISA